MSIYIISTNTNDVDGSNCIIGFKRTEEEAKQIVESLKQEYRTALNFYEEIIAPASLKFRNEFPSPELPSFAKFPSWPKGINQNDITQEMRDERKAIKDQNSEKIKEYSQAFEAWQKKEMLSIAPLIEPVVSEEWFKRWLEVNERVILFEGYGLVPTEAYIYELCEEI